MHALLNDSHLSKKDKSLLLVGLFAARREEQAMLHFTEIAVEAGNNVNEIAELISAAIISRGIPTWLSGIEAITKAIELTGTTETTKDPQNISAFSTQEECVSYYQSEFDQLPKWISYLIDFAPDTLLKYSNLRTTSLRDGVVSRYLKELLLYAINICDQYPKGIDIHKENAIQMGATDAVLQDVKTICIYAVGVHAVLNY
ncbi:Carboxymuconolactone decarboxylase family protein [Psychrobacillus sp. OK028]|uniref:carboxymuconolactone decarboxylase family protein n=1 Tax=Psychrobacillus sp. OK028 TaxID=1884359 RepID=UPI0008851188|nr:carboxymuconolactone decarboxylase family protein [Psychrobacillus sp. OK028]SDN75373.1 Carboxymuconolactone decarboxylase family protein [Psychrobacillus sp. OK028]